MDGSVDGNRRTVQSLLQPDCSNSAVLTLLDLSVNSTDFDRVDLASNAAPTAVNILRSFHRIWMTILRLYVEVNVHTAEYWRSCTMQSGRRGLWYCMECRWVRVSDQFCSCCRLLTSCNSCNINCIHMPVIYDEIVHRVQIIKSTENRKKIFQIKTYMRRYTRLDQLTAKKITSHISFFDKIHPLSLLYWWQADLQVFTSDWRRCA